MAVAQPHPSRYIHIEYRGFRNTADCREYLLVARLESGDCEFRFSIPLASFTGGRVRLQDGPDVCFQKLVRELAEGEAAHSGGGSITEAELSSYRAAHEAPSVRRGFAAPGPRPVLPTAPPRVAP